MNSTSKVSFIVAMVAVVIAIIALFVSATASSSAAFGATNAPTRFPNGYLDTGGGYYVDGSAVVNGSGSLVGTISQTTSNAATSTAVMGCVQTYATSTATAVRLVLSTIASTSPTYSGTNTIGFVGWQYGTCPN